MGYKDKEYFKVTLDESKSDSRVEPICFTISGQDLTNVWYNRSWGDAHKECRKLQELFDKPSFKNNTPADPITIIDSIDLNNFQGKDLIELGYLNYTAKAYMISILVDMYDEGELGWEYQDVVFKLSTMEGTEITSINYDTIVEVCA